MYTGRRVALFDGIHNWTLVGTCKWTVWHRSWEVSVLSSGVAALENSIRAALSAECFGCSVLALAF